MMTGTPELLPCPFCGAMPHSHADNIRHNPDDLPWNGQWIIECNACPVDSSTWAPTKDKAVEQWNTRVPPSTAVDGETIQILLDLLNPLHGELDRQTYDDKHRENFDAPKDAEYSITITAQMERDLTQAVLILEDRKRRSPTLASEKEG